MLASCFYGLVALARPSHDVDRENATLMTSEQVIDEIADDRVRFVAEFRHDSANQRVAPAVPFEINRAVKIARAMNFCPTVRPSRLFRPRFNEVKFLFQLRVTHDLTA